MVSTKEITEMYREKVTENTTSSGIPVKEVYTPEDIAHIDYGRDIGFSGTVSICPWSSSFDVSG